MRGIVRGAAAVAALSGLLSGCFWGQSGYDAKGGGYNPVERTITAATAPSLVEQWTAEVDRPDAYELSMVQSGTGLIHVSDGDALYGLDAATGTRRWRTAIAGIGDEYRVSGPAGGNTDVVVASGTDVAVPSRNLHRLDARTGEELGTSPLNWWGWSSDAHGDTSASVRSGSWAVTTSWEAVAQAGFPPTTLSEASIAVTNLADPARSWTLDLGWYTGVAAPIIVGGRVYAVVSNTSYQAGGPASRQWLRGWDLDTPCTAPCTAPFELELPVPAVGDQGWPDRAPAASPDGRTIFVVADGALRAVDVGSEAIAWTGRLASAAPVDGTPIVTPDGVFVDEGSVRAYPLDGCSATSCEPIRSLPSAGPPLAAASDVVAVRDGTAVQLHATTCTGGCAPRWAADLGADPLRAMIAGGRLVVAARGGTVHAFGLPAPPAG